jgi:AcrR family transcriptional regulator
VHHRILDASLEELREVGWENLTMDAIAQRAGVGKATIYRRWCSKAQLLLEALLDLEDESLQLKDTGNLTHDLRRQMHALVDFFVGDHQVTVRAILAAVQTDEEVAAVFRDRWLLKRKCVIERAMALAVDRGQMNPVVDADLMLDLLYAPLYFRLVMGHEELSHSLVDRLLDSVLPVFGIQVQAELNR